MNDGGGDGDTNDSANGGGDRNANGGLHVLGSVEKIYKGRSCNTQRFTITRIIATLNTLELDCEYPKDPK